MGRLSMHKASTGCFGSGSSSSRLVNLTITGGSKPLGLGGGIYVESSNLDLENVWIVSNQAYLRRRSRSRAWYSHSRSRDDQRQCEQYGGGVYLFGIGQTLPETIGRLEIRNSTISGNHADQVGGAIYIAAAGQLLIEYSTIAENTNRPGDDTIDAPLRSLCPTRSTRWSKEPAAPGRMPAASISPAMPRSSRSRISVWSRSR